MKDSNGKQCYDENEQITVKVEAPSGKELKHTITSDNNGNYNFSFTPDCIGQHNVVIEINGQPLTSSLWRVHGSPHRYKSLFSFGSFGKGQGQFVKPLDIEMNDTTGNIAVADFDNNRVKVFSLEGEYIKGVSAKELIQPTSVAFTRSTDLIVISSCKIFCFNESGKFLKIITSKHLKEPYHLTIARDGRMVGCDLGLFTVKVLTSDGSQQLLTRVIQIVRGRGTLVIRPWYVCHQDMFAVSYLGAITVKVFSKDGVFVYSIGTAGSDDGQLSFPAGLTIDRF